MFLKLLLVTCLHFDSAGSQKCIKRFFGRLICTFIEGIVSDSNNIFLWHESEDINKKSLFLKFQLIPNLRFQVMHDHVCFIAPIDYCVE